MELLVYVRNYPSREPRGDGPARRDLGAVVGEPATVPCRDRLPCSFVEVRLPADVIDPCTEIELLVAKAFAAWGHPGGGRVLHYATARGRVALLLEPGFERARDLCRALQPALPHARSMLERASAQVCVERAAARPAPRPVVEAEPVAPIPQHVDDVVTAPLEGTRQAAAPAMEVAPADDAVHPLEILRPVPYRFVPPPLPRRSSGAVGRSA